MEEPRLIVDQIREEIGQEHGARKQLYIDLEQELEMPLVSFFTSFSYFTMIEDDDADPATEIQGGRIVIHKQK